MGGLPKPALSRLARLLGLRDLSAGRILRGLLRRELLAQLRNHGRLLRDLGRQVGDPWSHGGKT